jgi:hypothetical protein
VALISYPSVVLDVVDVALPRQQAPHCRDLNGGFHRFQRPLRSFLSGRFVDFLAAAATTNNVCSTLTPVIPHLSFFPHERRELADGGLWGLAPQSSHGPDLVVICAPQ